jgi:hypothetical protein
MESLKSSQIAQFLNEILDGVERSNLGSIHEKDENGNLAKNKEGKAMLATLPYNVFLSLVASMAPKYPIKMDIDGKMN